MWIKRIEIDNFMPFGEGFVLELKDPNALTCVHGPNGAGKTALFEAVYWALTGDLVRNVLAEGVLRHGAKRCSVTVDIDEHTIKREWTKSQKRVWLDDQVFTGTDGTKAIREALGFDAKVLALTAFCGPKFETFSRARPEDRARIIDFISKARMWEAAQKEAARQHRNLSASRAGLKQNRRELENDISSKENAREKVHEELDELRKAAKAKIQDLDDELSKVNSRIKKKKRERLEIDDQLKEADAQRKKAREERDTSSSWLRELQRNLGQLNKDKERQIKLINQDTCPLCGQGMEDVHAKAQEHLDELGLQIQRSENEIAEQEETQEKLNNKYDVKHRAVNKLENDYDSVDDDIKDLEMQEHELDVRRVRAESDDRIARLEAKSENLSEDLEAMRKRADIKGIEIAEIADHAEACEFWAQGFKRIRFHVMERTAAGLSEVLTATVHRLGLDADSAHVSMWRPDSRGDSRPSVNVTIERDGISMQVEALSEGETQKMDFALFIAIGAYIRQVTGFDPGFRVIDEPFSHQDETGRWNAFHAIEAIDGQRFVMSHNPDFNDLFTDRLTLAKIDRVSSLQP